MYERLDYIRLDRRGIHCRLCDRTLTPDPDAKAGADLVLAHRERCNEYTRADKIAQLHQHREHHAEVSDGD